MKINPDKFRMATWLVIGLSLYLASTLVTNSQPMLQTVLYKYGHVTTLAWIGYWIARNTIGRINQFQRTANSDGQYLARAIILAGIVIAGSLGL